MTKLSRSPDVAAFLLRARDAGVITQQTFDVLADFVRSGEADLPTRSTQPTTQPSTSPPAQPEAPDPVEVSAAAAAIAQPSAQAKPLPKAAPPRLEPIPPPPRPPRPPSQWRIRAEELRSAIVSDVAVHGFSYLGVVLTFVGVLGFLLFAFVDFPNATQPFVELFIAAIFFGWAWWLRRQQAIRVAQGMELIGGMILPLVVFAGLVDGAPVPPDFTGSALVAALPAVSLLLAAAYARFSAIYPTSTLRYLAGPLVWLAAMTFGFAFKSDEPLVGVAVTRLVSMQPALAAAALAATVIIATRRPASRLAQPTMRAAVIGLPIAYLLTVSLAVTEGWEQRSPLVILGIALLVAVEVLAGWFDRPALARSLRPILIALVLAPLVPALGAAWTGLVAVVTYLTLFEANKWVTGGPPTRLSAAGVIVGAVMSAAQPVTMLLAFGVLSVWAHSRRRATRSDPNQRIVYAAFAALSPAGVILALLRMYPNGTAWLISTSLIAVLALVVRIRTSEDAFWPGWIVGASSIVAAAAAAEWWYVSSDALGHITAVAVAAASISLVTRWPVGRLWASAAVGSTAALMVQESLHLSAATRTSTWAVLGLALVVTSVVVPARLTAHLAVMGHLVGAGALLALQPGAVGAIVLWAWTLGWVATTVAGQRGEDPLTVLSESAWDRANLPPQRLSVLSCVAPIMALTLVIPSTVTTASLWPAFTDHRSWTGIALSVVATAYGWGAVVLRRRARLVGPLSVGASLLAAAGVAVAAPDPWPSIYATASVLGVALLLTRARSTAWFAWFAWLMSGALVVQLAERAGVEASSLHLVATSWAVAALIGGLMLDDQLAGRRAAGEGVRTAWIRHPVVLGAMVLPVSLSPFFSRPPDVFGWWVLAAAAAYAIVAWLLKAGSVTAPAYALAALGAAALSPRPVFDEPWLFSLIIAPMLAVAVLAERRQSALEAWLRWDLAPLAVGHVVAAIALIRAVAIDKTTSAALSLGLLAMLYGLSTRRRPWIETGYALVVLAAATAGTGWLALGLAATSLWGMVGAARTGGWARLAYHGMAVGAAGGAWLTLLLWRDVDTLTAIDLTSAVFGLSGLAVAGLGRMSRLKADSVIGWGGLALAGVALSFGEALVRVDTYQGVWLAVGVGATAIGMELASRQLGRALEVPAVAATGLAWIALLLGLERSVSSIVAVTALMFGGVGLAVGVLARRQRMGLANTLRWGSLAAVAVVAAAVGAIASPDSAIGPWAAIGVAALAVAVELAWPVIGHESRHAVPIIGAVAWVVLASGLGWTAAASSTRTAVVFGALTLLVAEYARLSSRRNLAGRQTSHQQLQLGRTWAGVGAAGLIVSIAIVTTSSTDAADTFAAVGLAVLALALARAAQPLQVSWLRIAAVVVGLLSASAAAAALSVSDRSFSLALISLGAVASVTYLGQGRSTPDSVWLRPLLTLAAAATVQSGLFAAGTAAARPLWSLIVVTAGLVAIAHGIVEERPRILALSPPLIGAGALLMAAEVAGGSAQWYTIPIALIVLTEVEIVRAAADEPMGSVLILEWSGLALLAAPPLVEMFTAGIWLGLVGIAVAAGILIWAIITRVQRRALAAAALVITTAILMIFAAAGGGAPDSAYFWVLAIGIGFTVMLLAALAEAYRSVKGRTMVRFAELMEGWE